MTTKELEIKLKEGEIVIIRGEKESRKYETPAMYVGNSEKITKGVIYEIFYRAYEKNNIFIPKNEMLVSKNEQGSIVIQDNSKKYLGWGALK